MYKDSLLGFLRWLGPVPYYFWRRQRDAMVMKMEQDLARLTADHRRAYRLALEHTANTGIPLEIMDIAALLNLTIDRTEEIIDDLEKITGLVKRNNNGSITSVYPATLNKVRGGFILDGGEELGAEGPLGALGLALVMGRLRGKDVSGYFTSDCALCHRPLHFMVASGLALKWLEKDAELRLFLPLVTDKAGTEGILFCLQNSTWYCTEEHAREHRRKTGGVRGYYLTPDANFDFIARLMEVVYRPNQRPNS